MNSAPKVESNDLSIEQVYKDSYVTPDHLEQQDHQVLVRLARRIWLADLPQQKAVSGFELEMAKDGVAC